jgi:hypothetical protein
MKTAEAAYSKDPTSVKDYDMSAVVETNTKSLKIILKSYD